jgi:protein-tyrosine-phosphatase
LTPHQQSEQQCESAGTQAKKKTAPPATYLKVAKQEGKPLKRLRYFTLEDSSG